jgi:hypothetical protein
MSETRPRPDRDASRAQRGEAALVAQYLHELSERHGGGVDDDSARAEAGEGSDGDSG